MNQYWKIIIAFVVLFSIAIAAVVQVSQTRITDNEDFFTLSIGGTPIIDGSTWSMPVRGNVSNPLVIDYTYLLSLPKHEATVTLSCVDGPSDTAVWGGVLLTDILDIVEVETEATEVAFFGADGYASSLTLEEARAGDVLLAYEMNGETLPRDHGFPVRLVVPNNYGYKWVKWIERIEVVDFDFKGYWESRGWSDDASIKPFNYWAVHAVLFSAAAVAGGLSGVSGLKHSKHTKAWRKMPEFMTRSFHNNISYIYFVIYYPTFAYWAYMTLENRGDLFYTNHGLLALTSLILHTIGLTASLGAANRNEKLRTIHMATSLLGYLIFLGAILTGLLKAF